MGRGTTYYTIFTQVAKRISSHTENMTLSNRLERTTQIMQLKKS